jgi:autotransporter translocation and assembly factor TamB
VLRGLAWVLCGLLIAVLVALASGLVWLESASGHRFVGRALVRAVSERGLGTLSVGGVEGSVIADLRLTDVALHDRQGRLVARADAVSARYRPLRLYKRHEIQELTVVKPALLLDHAGAAEARRPTQGQGRTTGFAVRRIEITEGSVRSGSRTLARLAAGGSVRVAGDGAVEIEARVAGEGFEAAGHGRYAEGRLDGALERLDVDPARAAGARRWLGRGPLHARGSLAGPLDRLELEARGHTMDRALALRAKIDVPQRSAKLSATLAAPRRSAQLLTRGQLRDRVLTIPSLTVKSGASRVQGRARVQNGALIASVAARVAPAEARLVKLRPAGPIVANVGLRGRPRALDVRVRGSLRGASAHIAGRVDLATRRGRLAFEARDVRPFEIVGRGPRDLSFSGAFTFDGGLERRALVGELAIAGGRLHVPGNDFDHLLGHSTVRLGQPGEAHVHALSGRLAGARPKPASTQTDISWNRERLLFEIPHVTLEGSRSTGQVLYTHDPRTRAPVVTVQLRRLALAPALVHELLHYRPPSPWTGSGRLVWRPGSTDAGLELATEVGPATASAQLVPIAGGHALSLLRVDVAGGRLRGSARYQDGQLTASLDELVLTPRLIRRVVPALDPAGAFRITGSAAGPLHALSVRTLVTASPSTAELRGRLDLRARTVELVGFLDTFQLEALKRSRDSTRVTLDLSLVGHLTDAGLFGTLTVRNGSGMAKGSPFYRGRADARLDGSRFELRDVHLDVPGARVAGKGGGSFSDFNIGYGIVITDALKLRQVPHGLRVLVGVTFLVPGNAVEGAIKRSSSGKVVVSHHIVPPGIRWARFLFRLLTGREPIFRRL